MIEHSRALQLSSLVVDEPIAQELERELAMHLVSCPDCKSLYEGIGRVRSAFIDALPAPPDSHAVDHAVYRASTVLRGEADPGPLERPDHRRSVAVRSETTGEMISEELTAVEGEPTPFDEIVPAKLPRRERRAVRREERGRRPRRALLFGLIALVAGVAVVAALLVVQGPGVRNPLRPKLPTPVQLRNRVDAAFDGLKTLEVSTTVTRLGLHRRPDGQRLLFAVATESTRVVFEAPDKLREERTLTVPGGSKTSTNTVRPTANEIRVLSGGVITTTTNAALGPPDGALRSRLGALERSLGAIARLIVGAQDLKVVEKAKYDGRDAYRVTFSVPPNEFTRADRVEALVDGKTFMPLQGRRSIAVEHASVLSPGTPLTPAAIEAAFGGKTRVTTETVEVDKLTVNDVVLPGEFVLTEQGAREEAHDAGWQRLARAELAGKLGAPPPLPDELPVGFRETGYVVFGGAKPVSIPSLKGGSAPENVLQAAYTDGKATIVLAQRRYRRRPEATGSPFAAQGQLPVHTRQVLRSGRELTYAVSPELPPHVYGFAGDVFVVVTGWASEDELLRVAASVPAAAAAAGSSPQPSASPRGSPQPTPSPRV